MKIDIQNSSGVHVVRISAERLEGEDQSLVKALTDLLDNRGARIVIDLSQVKFINSSGLGALVTMTAQANQRESPLVLAAPSAFIAGVFETTQLDRFFRVHPSVDAAVASLK